MAEKAKVIKKKSASPVPKAQPEADLKALLTAKLLHNFSVQPESATNEHFYNALVLVLRDMMRARRVEYIGEAHRQQSKQVYYLCMEFLMGRSLKNTLYNLNLTEEARQVLDGFHVKLDALFELEPDAGLGNGGLGRLAACFIDSLASLGVPAFGYGIQYKYGIFKQEFDKDGKVLSVEEKPQHPKSNYAITGLYFYNKEVVEMAKQVKPSARGELEITTLNDMYLKKDELDVQLLGRGFAWLDTGTMESLVEAADFVHMIEKRQGIKISAPEEIAFKYGWIDRDTLLESAERYGKSPYGQHLKNVAEGKLRY